MKFFTFSDVRTSPYGGYEQTIWCADNGAQVRKMWQSGGEAGYTLLSVDNRIIVNNDDTLTAFVVAWQAAWQHDEDLEADARLQTERYGFFVSLNTLRRTWGTYWISGDRPTWLAEAWQAAWQHDEDLEASVGLQTERYDYFIAPGAYVRTWGTNTIPGDYPED